MFLLLNNCYFPHIRYMKNIHHSINLPKTDTQFVEFRMRFSTIVSAFNTIKLQLKLQLMFRIWGNHPEEEFRVECGVFFGFSRSEVGNDKPWPHVECSTITTSSAHSNSAHLFVTFHKSFLTMQKALMNTLLNFTSSHYAFISALLSSSKSEEKKPFYLLTLTMALF